MIKLTDASAREVDTLDDAVMVFEDRIMDGKPVRAISLIKDLTPADLKRIKAVLKRISI